MMPYFFLLADIPDRPSAESCAPVIFDALALSDGQIRESSNFPGGSYYLGHLDEAKVTVSESDGDYAEACLIKIVGPESALNEVVARLSRFADARMPDLTLARLMNYGRSDEQRLAITSGAKREAVAS